MRLIIKAFITIAFMVVPGPLALHAQWSTSNLSVKRDNFWATTVGWIAMIAGRSPLVASRPIRTGAAP